MFVSKEDSTVPSRDVPSSNVSSPGLTSDAKSAASAIFLAEKPLYSPFVMSAGFLEELASGER